MKEYFEDEKKWIAEETGFLDRIVPFFREKLLLKILLLVSGLYLLRMFHEILLTLLCISFVSYVRFKRVRLGINIEAEPTYLLGISIALAFGMKYAILYVLVPGLIVGITSGLGPGLAVNVINKMIVIYFTYVYWIYTHDARFLILVAILLVILTDIMGFFLRKRLGQPLPEIVQVVATNSVIRLAYFSLLLEIVIGLLN